MRYAGRICNPVQSMCDDAWKLVEDKPPDAAATLVETLERAVSQGYFGLASELSDALESEFADDLNADRALRSHVLLERMKRWVYMGYVHAASRAAKRAISNARDWAEHEDTPLAVHALRTSLGYLAWLTDDPTDLETIIREARQLDARLDPGSAQHTESHAFTRALEGRVAALRSDAEACDTAFRDALMCLSRNDFLRSRAHVLVLHAEHLVDVERIEDALIVCRTFMEESTKTQLRSHLLFRALHVLMQHGSNMPGPAKRALELRWHVLLHAMGLSQSLPVYPRLASASHASNTAPSLDLFSYDLEANLTWWLDQVSSDAMERIIAELFRLNGFKVDLLSGSTPAIDLVATLDEESLRPESRVGVQVKRWRNTVNKGDIPRVGDLRSALDIVRARGHAVLNSLHWYCASGLSSPAQEELRALAVEVLGPGCTVDVTDKHDLVRQLVAAPLVLPHLVFLTTIEESTFGQ